MDNASWIIRCLRPTPGDSVLAQEAYAAYSEECLYRGHQPLASNHFGRLVMSVLPDTIVTRTNRNGKRHSVYKGLVLKLPDLGKATDVPKLTLNGILPLCPPGWSQFTSADTEVCLSKDLGYTVSDSRLTLYLTVCDTGEVRAAIGATAVDLVELGVCPRLDWTQSSVVDLLTAMNCLRLCFGVPRPRLSTVSSTRIDDWVYPDGRKEKRMRSERCSRVCPMEAVTDNCRACKKIKDHHANAGIALSAGDCDDMKEVFETVLSSASPQLATLIKQQLKASEVEDSRGMRWDPAIIRMALSIYCRSPRAYRELQQSNFLKLPSGRLLQYYKNSVSQEPGFNWEQLKWMASTAKDSNVPAEGYRGGLILDEISIQEDLQLSRSGDTLTIVGFSDNGEEADSVTQSRKKSHTKEVANKVQQYVFLGYTGFRFPVAHFPTRGATATDMHIQFWEGVAMLGSWGFTVDYTNMDGGCTNRQWLHMHFQNDAKDTQYACPNPTDRSKSVVFIMDYSHVIKKIRNSLFASSGKNKNRDLTLSSGDKLHWSMWVEAYQWGRHTAVGVHKKITREHVFLDESSKMRNKLAEEVLGYDMLSLMLDFQQSLGEEGTYLNGAIALITETAKLIKIFRDRNHVSENSDERLTILKDVYKWFKDWEQAAKSPKELITSQAREDLESCILGFLQLVKQRVKQLGFVTPSRINSDVVENVFCQVRSVFGAATNLTHKDYKAALNNIVLMQNAVSISKKSNAAPQTNPYSVGTSTPLVSNRLKRRVTPHRLALADLDVNSQVHQIDVSRLTPVEDCVSSSDRVQEHKRRKVSPKKTSVSTAARI